MATERALHNETIQFGTFTLGTQMFGVDILRMREIIRPVEITKVPRAEGYVEGVINLRGVVIPIISLRARFGMPTRPFDKETRIINMEIDNTVIGFIVDSIGHVQRFSTDSIEAPPAVAASIDSEYITGLVNGDNGTMIIVLNVDKLVSAETLQQFMQVENVG